MNVRTWLCRGFGRGGCEDGQSQGAHAADDPSRIATGPASCRPQEGSGPPLNTRHLSHFTCNSPALTQTGTLHRCVGLSRQAFDPTPPEMSLLMSLAGGRTCDYDDGD